MMYLMFILDRKIRTSVFAVKIWSITYIFIQVEQLKYRNNANDNILNVCSVFILRAPCDVKFTSHWWYIFWVKNASKRIKNYTVTMHFIEAAWYVSSGSQYILKFINNNYIWCFEFFFHFIAQLVNTDWSVMIRLLVNDF